MRSASYPFCLVLLGACAAVFAQPPDILWTNSYGGSTNDYCRSVLQTDDGGFYLIGMSGWDLSLLKVDENGLLEWEKTFGGSGYDFGEDAQRTLDGGLIITGWTHSFGAADGDLWLLKLDSLGGQEWSSIFGCDSVDRGFSVCQSPDGGFAATGVTTGSAGDPELYIVKVNEYGSLEWEQSYGGTDSDIGFSIEPTTDDGFIITGSTYMEETDADLWLIKTDSFGEIVWEETFGDSLEEVGYSVSQTSDGGFIVTGYTLSYATGADIFLLKTDNMGSVDWTSSFGDSDWDRGDDVIQTIDGGFVLTGSTTLPGASIDISVVKTFSDGGLDWQMTVGDADHDEYGYSILQLPDGGFIIGGDSRSFSTGDHNMFLARLAPPEGIADDDDPESNDLFLHSIAPNPSFQTVEISFFLPVSAHTDISVLDLSGRVISCIQQGVMPAGENCTDWNGCSQSGFPVSGGVYLIRIESMGQIVTGRLVVFR
ncbi:MAG: T9SS type A sorting domain-containing protein [Candidatus Sabulitectum sp.]|nr:T9SS type A sorting domain-containing protein [Candidatus Sabulitectum sp.]